MPRSKKEKINKQPLHALRGMRDILPDEWEYWDYFIKKAETLAKNYGYRFLETPILEDTSLFIRGTGVDTDIVEKEMYSFATKGGDNVSLRPEGTPGIVRAYIENGMNVWPHPVKVYYLGPMFRYERPQAGRYRQFHHFGFEAIGEESPILDVQIIQLTWKILESIGLKGLSIQINSIGCAVCRKAYRKLLIDYYEAEKNRLCQDCRRRFVRNPLRLLDCKEEKCMRLAALAPQTIDHLCQECHDHFKSVLEYLDELELPYTLNPRLVRGLDYYTRTVFEIWPQGEENFRGSLAGGGRYDDLVEILGGSSTPAIGSAIGIERVIEELKVQEIRPSVSPQPKVFLVQLGELARKKSLKLFSELIEAGIQAAESFSKHSIKSQLKLADKLGAKIALILGQKEALDETIIIRDMKSGMQEIVNFKKVIKELKKRIK